MSSAHHYSPAWLSAKFFVSASFALTLILSFAPSQSAAENSGDLAAKAMAILEQNCGNSGCHGGSNPYSFDVRNPATLLEAKVIQPGNAAGSEMIRRLEAGVMPLGGYNGQRGAKLPEEEIQALRAWVDAGALAPPRRGDVARPFISESQVLHAIVQDLEAAPKANRPFLRYFSLANLWNASDVDGATLGLYRAALGKLVNHLSWKKEIVRPAETGLENTLLRIDLRNYRWNDQTWDRITAAYPYGAMSGDYRREAAKIHELSGAAPPYLRADWFITSASVSPLYSEILELPSTVEGLERMLKVDSTKAQRFGIRDSGISRNNRVMERSQTQYGAFWKSFDFAGNRMDQNIFRDPIHLKPDGGEIIFNLPNGLQGYLVVNAQGKRIDDAPIGIVRDRTNPDDPVVHNGRSCMGCHVHGVNAFQDEVRPALETRSDALFDIARARRLYPGQLELEDLLDWDSSRFTKALTRTGSVAPAGSQDEPINQVARIQEGALTVSRAAAELFIQEPEELQRRIENSPALQKQGFDQLLGPNGGIKRDTWEQGFGLLVREMGMGAPATPLTIPRGTKLLVSLETLVNARTVRTGDKVFFRAVGDMNIDGRVAIPQGSLIQGAIEQIQGEGADAWKAGIQVGLEEAQLRDGTVFRLPSSTITMKANVSENSGGWRRPTPLPGVWGTGKGGSTSAAATAVAAQILIAATRGAATPPWRESPPISEDASAPQRDATPSDSIPIGTVFEARF